MKEKTAKKPAYEKPIFEPQEKMIFPYEIIQQFNEMGRFCMQCTGCHGCR